MGTQQLTQRTLVHIKVISTLFVELIFMPNLFCFRRTYTQLLPIEIA